MTLNSSPDAIRKLVRDQYGAIARDGGACVPGCCDADALAAQWAERIGYDDAARAEAPEAAGMSLGCGNPHALAQLREGEAVLDLGSGGGLDAFLAAKQVGTGGHVIGVDMTADMVEKARVIAASEGYDNVDFRLGEIEALPVADARVDAILSNCVINLSPEKPRVFAEAFRVLKPGGRLAISDIVLTEALPAHLQEAAAHVGCVAGASTVAELEGWLEAAGFEDVRIVVDESSRAFIAEWYPGSGAERYVASARIEAVRPRGAQITAARPGGAREPQRPEDARTGLASSAERVENQGSCCAPSCC